MTVGFGLALSLLGAGPQLALTSTILILLALFTFQFFSHEEFFASLGESVGEKRISRHSQCGASRRENGHPRGLA
jgi:hypothetical protein